MRHWLRSLHAQLLLWAVLPITFAIIAFAFTGVYAHQRMMRDFVAARDLTLARLTAGIIEDGLAHGTINTDGQGLEEQLQLFGNQPETVTVVDGQGQTLAATSPQATVIDSDWVETLQQGESVSIFASEAGQPVLVASAPVGGTGWLVLVQEPVEEIIGPILRFSNLAPLVAAGAGILSLLVLTFGWRTIVRPLQRLSRAAEQVSWGNVSAIATPVGGVQEVQDLHAALADMVERIRGYQAGMRDYLGALTEGQETERARLACELHDGPVQELIALGQQAEMARRLMERGEAERTLILLEELRHKTRETVEALRRLIAALRPAYLEDLGLRPALEALVREAARRTHATVRLEAKDIGDRFAPEIELAVYRIAQEALNNALQHASAQTITLRVQVDAGDLLLSVADDGVGFVPHGRPDLLTHEGHFGLVGMHERASRLGGTLEVHAAPGAGTQVFVRLPLRFPDAG